MSRKHWSITRTCAGSGENKKTGKYLASEPNLSHMVDRTCWNCGEQMKKRPDCELQCERCGFIRDCSDP